MIADILTLFFANINRFMKALIVAFFLIATILGIVILVFLAGKTNSCNFIKNIKIKFGFYPLVLLLVSAFAFSILNIINVIKSPS